MTKVDRALGMIEGAVQDGIPGEILLADSAYGESQTFRDTVRLFAFDYAVGIHAPRKVGCLDVQGQHEGDASSAQDLGVYLGATAFRRFTWREGMCAELSSCFCFRRVKVAQDFSARPDGRARPVRSASRPERHFEDSFITARHRPRARDLTATLPLLPPAQSRTPCSQKRRFLRN